MGNLSILQFHENWIELMVSVLGLNVATKVVLDYLRQVGGAAVVQKTTKMLDEMDEHITFATEWCRRFRHRTKVIPRTGGARNRVGKGIQHMASQLNSN